MLREVALRLAIEDARARRALELEEIVDRQGALRRRLRELQDRLLALGMVHGRFAGPEERAPTLPAPQEVMSAQESSAPLPIPSPPVEPAAVRAPQEPSASAADVRLFLAPPKGEGTNHAPLLMALASRHPDGFTVSQLREVMDATEPERSHSYDAAWGLANSLLRTQTLELAGTRPGPSGAPIRVYRVHSGQTMAIGGA